MNFMTYGGWCFSYPELLLDSTPPQLAGVYAIQVINPTWTPLPYEPIYFGESEDLARRDLTVEHPAFDRWCDHHAVRDGGHLYVSYLWLHRGSEFRKDVAASLIARYRPACNGMSSVAARPLIGPQPVSQRPRPRASHPASIKRVA